MGEIVNLRLARKAKARDEKARLAEENRARHGRTKAEKQIDRLSAEKSATFLDSHKRAPSTSPVAPQRGAGGGADAPSARALDDDPAPGSGDIPRD